MDLEPATSHETSLADLQSEFDFALESRDHALYMDEHAYVAAEVLAARFWMRWPFVAEMFLSLLLYRMLYWRPPSYELTVMLGSAVGFLEIARFTRFYACARTDIGEWSYLGHLSIAGVATVTLTMSLPICCHC